MMDWGEHIDDWGNEDYDNLFSMGKENLDDFDGDEEEDDDLMEITDIDFSNISGKTKKEKLKKITRKTTKAKIVPKKKILKSMLGIRMAEMPRQVNSPCSKADTNLIYLG